MGSVIEIKGLVKSFKDVRAVDGISFFVREGELFAFLGANGAGKSTTISMLCGRIEKDGGEIMIDGKNPEVEPAATRHALGVVFQSSVLDKSLSVRANLESRAALYGIVGKAFEARLAELADMLGFADILHRQVGKLSGGQRRRIDIARALIHHPRILILDEPTTGLDPQTRALLWRVIADLRAREGMTVFLTTHYMEEAAEADYVVILDAGKIAAEGTPHDLKGRFTGDFITLYNVDAADVSRLGLPFERVGAAYRICVPSTRDATELVLREPSIFVDYEITKGKMDDVFLAVTGKRLGEDAK